MQAMRKAALTADEHLAFIKKCEVYIGRLKAENKLIAAQPIVREGFIVSKMQMAGQRLKLTQLKKYRLAITT
jgi:hypothetical protein